MNRQKKNPRARQSTAFLIFIFIVFFTVPTNASGHEEYIKLKVVADQANIRLEPDISSIIIRQVPKGTILNATEKTGEWYAIQLTTQQGTVVSGYVHDSLVNAIDPLPKEKKPPVIPEITPEEPEEDEPTSRFPFVLSLMGGGNYVRGGDLNLGIKGLADLYEDTLGVRGEGKIGSVHIGYVLGLEVSFPLSPMLSWGIRAEHFQGKNNSEVQYTQPNSTSVLHIRPNLRATPVSIFLSFSPIPELYVKGGLSYCFSHCSYTYLLETDNSTQSWKGKANARGLGLMGGIGYLRKISPNLSFFAELAGRLSKMRGFTGEQEMQDPSGKISTEEGTLWLIQAQVLMDRTHSILFIRKTRPNEAGFISATEAQIDYSGMSIMVGLRFHF